MLRSNIQFLQRGKSNRQYVSMCDVCVTSHLDLTTLFSNESPRQVRQGGAYQTLALAIFSTWAWWPSPWLCTHVQNCQQTSIGTWDYHCTIPYHVAMVQRKPWDRPHMRMQWSCCHWRKSVCTITMHVKSDRNVATKVRTACTDPLTIFGTYMTQVCPLASILNAWKF